MKYICTGATLRCTMGTSCPKLKATPKNVSLTGKDQANIADYVSIKNIPSFGRCRSLGYPPTASATAANHGKLTPMPCVPGTCPKWQAIDKDSLICGEPALLEPATLRCMYGGTISIVNPGQSLEIKVRGVSFSQRSETQQEKAMQEIPEELLQEFNALDRERLSQQSVLDGVQMALDVAGMAPGVGAIPDLMNAAISVLRGDWVGAGLSIVAAVPGVGDVVGGAKIAYRGAKIAKNTSIGNRFVKSTINTTKKITLEQKKAIAQKFISKDVSKEQLLKEKGVTSENVDEVLRQIKIERKREAINFYKEYNLSESMDTMSMREKRNKIVSEINGIDFNFKIERGMIQDGDILYQYSKNDSVGNYFAKNAKQTPSQSGISPTYHDKSTGFNRFKEQLKIVFNKGGQPYLRTTSKRIDDTWSNIYPRETKGDYVRRVKTTGGGSQTYIPGDEWKTEITKERIDNVICLGHYEN